MQGGAENHMEVVNMRNLKSCMLAGVALGCFGIADGANAQQIFSGGSTFAAPTYRLLMDCWGLPADGVGADHTIDTGIIVVPVTPLCHGPGGAGTGDKSGLTAQILFAPTGSGGGKQALANHDPSTNTTTGLKTPGPSNTVPFTSTFYSTYPYVTLQFIGSDDPRNQSDVDKYTAIGGHAKYGNIIQIPAWAGAATIAFNGKDGTGAALTITNAIPAGGSSGLNLSRQALCGIFSGHITKWNNPILTALNGGTALGSGQITVVHRSDGSGTTFILTNGLETQCINQFGPNNETDSSLVLYELPWSDRVTSTTQCNAVAPKSTAIPFEGSATMNWPDVTPDQCGTAIVTPAGAAFANASGNSGVVAKIQTTNGAIGYSTTDYTLPVVAGPANANLQDVNAIDAKLTTFVPPTSTSVRTAMDSNIPLFPPLVTEPEDITNPLNWSRQAVNPDPVLPGAYPLAGWTFMDIYQCIKTTNTPGLADANNLNILFSYLTFQYTDPDAAAIINANGFANISATSLVSWYEAILTVAGDATGGFNTAGTGQCAAVSPGA
jgi:phosphate transport system substrate-binding protein